MLTTVVPIPMLGALPVNAYLILGEQPTLIDTGMTPEEDDFVAALKKLMDLRELQWIVITHADRDHTAALGRLLAEAPNARVVTTFITVGMMSIGPAPIPPERAFLVCDGSTVDLGDRMLSAARPPLFDNPGTLAFFDPKQSILFSSDCFGAPFTKPEDALADDVSSISEDELARAQVLWGNVDSPWTHEVEPARFAGTLARFVEQRPATVLSSHLPPIRENLDRHVERLATLPSSQPFDAPDQAALETFMAAQQP
jgi:flavorubredoxin